MRRITSPTSCPHRYCQQSQQIKSLAFTNLIQCNEHYRRRHWFTATRYDLLLSHCQRCRLPPHHSVNNEDGEDRDEDDEDEDDSNNDHDSEEDNEDDANEDEDDSDNDGDNEEDDNDNDDNTEDNNDNNDNEEDDNKDDDDKEEDDDDDNGLGLDEDLWCLCTQFNIVQRLIVVLLAPTSKSLTHHPPFLTIVSSPPFKTALAFQ